MRRSVLLVAAVMSLCVAETRAQLYVNNAWTTQSYTNIGVSSDAEYKSGLFFTRDYNWNIYLDNDISGPETSNAYGYGYGYVKVTNGITEMLPGWRLPAGCYRSTATARANYGSQTAEQTATTSQYCIPAPYIPPKPPCSGCTADGTPPVEYVGTPLLVNTGSGPWKLTGFDDPVLFDIDADGRADRMAWTARDSSLAFVALDLNGNGRVDDASELFGDHTRLPGGATAPNGFVALKIYDRNDDDVIDAGDAVWSNLLLWTDANHDGTSQSRELTTIADSTIRGLSTEYRRNGRTDSYGNEFRFKSQITTERGREPYYDIFFRVAP